MITIKAPEYNKRLEICRACPHFVESSGSCGTFLKGDLITVKGRKKKIRTCGCVMRIKAKLTWASCPINSWEGYITKATIKAVEALLKSLDEKPILKADKIQDFFDTYNKAFNKNKQVTNCVGCVKEMIKEMKDALKRYKHAEG